MRKRLALVLGLVAALAWLGRGCGPREARLEVNSSPEGAEVYVDGVLCGATPVVVALEPGKTYEIRLSAPGHEDLVIYRTPKPGERDSLGVKLRPRRALSVRSAPAGCRMFLDGEFVGHTPLRVPGLAPGRYHVAVVWEGYVPALQEVEVGEAADAEIEVALEKADRRALLVLSRPAGAVVYLDGAEVGPTPCVIREVPDGDHVLCADKGGYHLAFEPYLAGDRRGFVALNLAPVTGEPADEFRARRATGTVAVSRRPNGYRIGPVPRPVSVTVSPSRRWMAVWSTRAPTPASGEFLVVADLEAEKVLFPDVSDPAAPDCGLVCAGWTGANELVYVRWAGGGVTGAAGVEVCVFDPQTGGTRVAGALPVNRAMGYRLRQAWLTAGGDTLIAQVGGMAGERVARFDLATGRSELLSPELPRYDIPRLYRPSPDGWRLIHSDRGEAKGACVFDLRTGVQTRLGGGMPQQSGAWSPDGSRLAIRCGSSTGQSDWLSGLGDGDFLLAESVRVYSAEGKLLRSISLPGKRIGQVSWAPTSDRVILQTVSRTGRLDAPGAFEETVWEELWVVPAVQGSPERMLAMGSPNPRYVWWISESEILLGWYPAQGQFAEIYRLDPARKTCTRVAAGYRPLHWETYTWWDGDVYAGRVILITKGGGACLVDPAGRERPICPGPGSGYVVRQGMLVWMDEGASWPTPPAVCAVKLDELPEVGE